MKMNSNRDWLKKQAALEDGGFVSVGGFISSIEDATEESMTTAAEPLKHAFVRLLQLKRRERALTLEDLAKDADVDLVELISMEGDEHYVPRLLTVDRIATFFDLPKRPLMALAGLLKVKDAQFQEAALRFATRSEPVDKLSREEHRALEEYVRFLCDR